MSQILGNCDICDIFVSGEMSQCDILDGVLLRGFFQGNAAPVAVCVACRLPVLRLRGAVNATSALGRLEAVLTVPLRSGRTERESSGGAKGKGMRGSPRTGVGRLLWDMRGATIITGVWYISSDGLARGGVTGRGMGGSFDFVVRPTQPPRLVAWRLCWPHHFAQDEREGWWVEGGGPG